MSDETEDWPDLRPLFHEIEDYEGSQLLDDVLLSWTDRASQALRYLSPYRRADFRQTDGERWYEDLQSWYAISRVNELLLLGFQVEHTRGKWRGAGFYLLSEHWTPDGLERGKRQIDHSWRLSEQDYLGFFELLGFGVLRPRVFVPMHCEIVAVDADPDPNGGISVEEVLWPGLRFGELVFSRAGVRVRAGAASVDPTSAVTSTLQPAFWRLYRPTHDLSHGWGSNSQWSTDMRRDYETRTEYLYNVDCISPRLVAQRIQRRHKLPDGGEAYLWSEAPGSENLSVDERVELVMNRCLLGGGGQGSDLWPFDDTVVIPKRSVSDTL